MEIANYILYSLGWYKPYSEDNLKSIRRTYESDLNAGLIEPINYLYSPKYKMKMICDKIIELGVTEEIKLVFVLDYELAENRTDIKYHKKQYSFKGKIIGGGKEYTTPPMWDTKIHMLLNCVYTELKNNGIDNISVEYDMEQEDYDDFEGHLNWTDIKFDL